MVEAPDRDAVRRAGREWPHLARLARQDVARRAWLDGGRAGPRPEVEPEERAARRGEREARNAAILGRVAAGEHPREIARAAGVSPALVYKLIRLERPAGVGPGPDTRPADAPGAGS